MANISVENIRLLFDEISSLGFFGRIFGWGKLLHQNGAAYSEFQELNKHIQGIIQKFSDQKGVISTLEKEIDHYKSNYVKIQADLDLQKNLISSHLESIKQKEREIATLKEGERQSNSRILEQEGKIDRHFQ